MTLEIISKTKPIFSGEVEKLIVKTKAGEITVLEGHENLVSSLDIGTIRYFINGKEEKLFSDEGFLEITTTNGKSKITILANQARLPQELEKEAIEKAIQNAKEEMEAKKGTISESVLIQLEKKIRFEKFLKEQTDL